jgi:hypothetical protein
MVLVPFFEGAKPFEKWQWLTEELRADKIKYRSRNRAVEDHDAQYDSVMRALQLAAGVEAPFYEPGPLPPFPLNMHNQYEIAFWNGFLARVWHRGHETLRKGLIPVLNGNAERIPRTVTNYLREEKRKALRQWQILHGIKRAPATAAKGKDKTLEAEQAAWRTEWDISELAAKEIHPDTESIQGEVNSATSTPEESMADRERGKAAYDYALRRFGEKGRKFLNALIATEGDITAASQAAGISRMTGHKWRRELQIRLSQRNSPQ